MTKSYNKKRGDNNDKHVRPWNLPARRNGPGARHKGFKLKKLQQRSAQLKACLSVKTQAIVLLNHAVI